MKKLKLFTILLVICLAGCSKDDSLLKPNAITPPKVDEPITPPKEDNPNNTSQGVVVTPPEKPEDSYMGFRSSATYKVGERIYYKSIDIDELTANPSKFTADYLKSFINIHSSEPDLKKYYQFNDEDFKHVIIKEFSFSPIHKKIYFKTSYKGITSKFLSSLEFNPDEYYDYKIAVNNDYVSTHYMRGVYQDLGGFIDNLLIYDHVKYDIEFLGDNTYKEDYSDMLRFTFQLIDKRTNKRVANINRSITGFKKLKLIGTEMKIFTTSNFEKAVREKIKTIKNLDNTNNKHISSLKGYFVNAKLIQLTKVEANGKRLIWREDYLAGSGIDSDIYLKTPEFELESFTLNGNDIILHVNLFRANGEAINTPFDLLVKDIK